MKRYKKYFLLLFVISSLICSKAEAQGEMIFTSSKDLSSSMVNNIFQDDLGFVWVSSEDGLDVYDGVNFWNIHHVDGDSLSLVSNYVRFVYQDPARNIFVATLHGLQLFDRDTRTFHNVPINGGFGPLNIRPSVACICRVNDTLTVVGTSGYGIMLLQHNDDGFSLFTHRGVGLGSVGCIYKDDSGYIWMSGNNVVKKLNLSLEEIEVVTLPNQESATAITSTGDGTLLFGTSHGRVLVYDANAPSKYREIVSKAQNDMVVTCFCMDVDNTILMGTDGYGVKRLVHQDDGTWSIGDFDFALANNHQLKIHHIMRDRDGNFWFGCFQRGVLVVKGGSNFFDYIGRISRKRNVIGSCCVVSVYADSNNNIYVGTDNDGFYLLDPDYKLIQHYDCNQPGTIVPKVPLAFCEDSHGRLWTGGYQGGLVYLDRKTGTWHRYDLATASGGSCDDFSSVYTIVEDKERQNLWVSASGVGLFRIDANTLAGRLYGIKNSTFQHDYSTDQLCNAWVVSMMLSSDGTKLYIGTYSGFSCLDLNTESFVSAYGVNCFLEGYVVNSICEGRDGYIWVGTTDGLFKFDTDTRKFKRYGTAEGLPGTSISGIACDTAGSMWISSKSGISCLDAKTGKFVNYDSYDGLYSNEFMPDAVWNSQNGRILFGSVNGVIGFNPFARRNRDKSLNIRIVDFWVDNVPVVRGSKSGSNYVVDTAVIAARRFHLAHFDNSFEVEYSALDFDNPDRLKYSYRIDGGQWTSISGNRVSFAKLGYGEHTLEARVADNLNTSDVYTVVIEIDFPWYQSMWFYVLLALLVLGILVAAALLVRRRIVLNRHYKEMERAKELNDSRIEFFTNISHEIRTPISLIISPLYKLIATDDDPSRQRSYKTIKLNAQRILNLINQLLDMRKIDSKQLRLEFEKVDLVDFCRGIYESFEQYALSLGIDFLFDAEEESMEAYVDPKNFDKVIVNVLSNAFKYTPKGGKVRLSINRDAGETIRIGVSDQGTGIALEDIDHVFDLFYQGSNNHKITMIGTGVGMYLVRQLVTLHHGTVKAVNNTGGEPGCTFVIHIPAGRSHLTDREIFVRENPQSSAFSQMELAGVPEPDDEELKRYAKTSTRIVVVDDDEQLRKYIVDELGNYFHIKDFASCDEASTYIIKNKPDLVISDVMMSGMDGMSLCIKLKRNVDTNTIPVVLLTAASQENARIRALDIGADAFIAKPFNISVLSHTVTNLLRRNNTLRNSYLGRQDTINGVDMDEGEQVDSPDKKLLTRVLKVINENMSNPSLTVDMIAKAVGISRVHLHRKLKELTNQSTIDFLRNVRLNRALKLLRIKHSNISEVAQYVGFVSTAYFSTVFKDRFGCTPSAYMSDNATIEQMPLDDDELIS
ncbi:MAG: response regulator [Bacteroidales bacterium]|nr:response regulator [Bacteroidales bacterium]